VRSALHVVIAVIALLRSPRRSRTGAATNFPVMSLVIYVAGMVFIAMPLCLCYEALLKSYTEQQQTRRTSPT
jgi:cytochrome c oxidase assembly factor CtaG